MQRKLQTQFLQKPLEFGKNLKYVLRKEYNYKNVFSIQYFFLFYKHFMIFFSIRNITFYLIW